MTRPRGMTPAQFDRYIAACYYAGINPEKTSHGTRRVVQTIGSAKASAGTHARDGHITQNGNLISYSAATDISVRGLTRTQIKKFLQELARQGWAAWFRDWPGNQHIHAIYCSVPMKKSLQKQVISFLNNRDGLVGDNLEKFYTASYELDKPIAQAFVRANPSMKKRVPQYLLED